LGVKRKTGWIVTQARRWVPCECGPRGARSRGRPRGAGCSAVATLGLHASQVTAVWSLSLTLELLLVVEGRSAWGGWGGGRRTRVGVRRSETSRPTALQDQSLTASRWRLRLTSMSRKCEVVWRTEQKEQTKFQQERLPRKYSFIRKSALACQPWHSAQTSPHRWGGAQEQLTNGSPGKFKVALAYKAATTVHLGEFGVENEGMLGA